MHRYALLFAGLSLLASSCSAMYEGTDVVELTDANFERLVTDTDTVWLVEFYAPWCGHCQKLVPDYKEVAKALKGVIKVGAVDGDKYKSLFSRFGGRGFPTIKIFAEDRQKPIDYAGARTAQGMAEEAMRVLQNKVFGKTKGGKSGGSSSGGGGTGDVIELTDSNFNAKVFNGGKGADKDWLVEFYAPWCGHCKNLAPEWAKAATELKGKVNVAAVDATQHRSIASDYAVQGYPTIKFFPAGSRSASDAEEYGGGRVSSEIVKFGLEKFESNLPAPDVLEVTSQKVLEEACVEHSLCVVAILPQLLDCQSECRNRYIKMLKGQADSFKKNRWGWVWSEATSQPELESAFEMGGFGYPAMVVANLKKQKFSTLRGSFDQSGIHDFLRDLAYGRGITATLRSSTLPSLSALAGWDGKDGEIPAMEDIDLSDVELEDLGKTEL